jgi:hypothetical protein
MKFRDQEFNEVKVISAFNEFDLSQKISNVANQRTIIDLQFAVSKQIIPAYMDEQTLTYV